MVVHVNINSQTLAILLWILAAVVTTLSGVCAYTAAPAGCVFDPSQGSATCDFKTWSPPLLDSQFSSGVPHDITIQNINGQIPAQAFSGLGGPSVRPAAGLALTFECNLENIVLLADTFTSNLNWVETVSFQNCYIREGIPDHVFANLSGLRTLNTKSGIVGPLTNASLGGLSNLTTLVINSDFIDDVLSQGLFLGLSSIQEIDLKTSGITSLSPGSFTGLSNLQTLDLSSNTLATLPSGLFTSLSQLTTVALSSNTWDCTCDIAWLSTWALYSGVRIDVKCTTPPIYRGLTSNRALLALGCSNIYKDSSGTTISEDDTARQYAYIATGMAGLACVISGIVACVLISLWRNVKSSYPVSPSNLRYRKSKQDHTTPVTTIPTTEHRPPSYKSMDRLFVPSPKVGQRPKTGPYMNVHYRTNF